jgi:hypothetical protein
VISPSITVPKAGKVHPSVISRQKFIQPDSKTCLNLLLLYAWFTVPTRMPRIVNTRERSAIELMTDFSSLSEKGRFREKGFVEYC